MSANTSGISPNDESADASIGRATTAVGNTRDAGVPRRNIYSSEAPQRGEEDPEVVSIRAFIIRMLVLPCLLMKGETVIGNLKKQIHASKRSCITLSKEEAIPNTVRYKEIMEIQTEDPSTNAVILYSNTGIIFKLKVPTYLINNMRP